MPNAEPQSAARDVAPAAPTVPAERGVAPAAPTVSVERGVAPAAPTVPAERGVAPAAPTVSAAEPRDLASPLPFRRSLRASRERRVAAFRRRRRRLRGRTAVAVAALSLTALSGAALAAPVTLHAGARGGTVAALQRTLGIPADGVYGPQTRRAVRRYQRDHGLLVDGVAGPATLGSLHLRVAHAASPGGTLAGIAQCESGGDPTAVSADGRYRGKYQFSVATWRSVGGRGDPAAAPEREQDRRAALLFRRDGTAPWPNCA